MKINSIRILISLVFLVLTICYSYTLQAQVELIINNPANIAGSYINIGTADFGPPINSPNQITGSIVASDDIEGCSPFVNAVAMVGNIALIDRGSCQFQQKTANAQAAGAIAVIVCLVDDSGPLTMSGTNDTLTIPAILITKSLCDQIRMELPGVNVTMSSPLFCFEENIENIISTNARGAYNVYSIDLDGDGDNDVLSTSTIDDKIAWYENDGQGNFSSENIITFNTFLVQSIYSIDLDGDGDNDVLSASQDDDKIAWYANDGQGNFSGENIISTNADGANSVYSIDLDGDGDNDVLSTSTIDDKIAWYANDGQGNFSSENIISTNADGANSVYSIDIDGDSDNDVLSTYSGTIVWYANDGQGSFGAENIISNDPDGVNDIYSTDLDSDSDNDILLTSFSGDKIVWYTNDGQGNFSTENIISTDTNGATDVYSKDIDGDGDNDVLTASYFSDKIAWYANDGQGNFSAENIISTDANGAWGVYSADLDGDGDNDVLSASEFDNKVAWYENLCSDVIFSGCTNPDACNFDATATSDDGICILPGDTCDDGNPLTNNDTVQADCSCQGEMDSGDVVPTVGEWGLIILALMLLNLGVLYIRQTETRIEEG